MIPVITSNLDLAELDRALTTTEQRAKRLAPAFRQIRPLLRRDQRDHAQHEEAPEGRWPSRSPLTEARRKARNRSVRTTKAQRTVAIARFKRRPTPAKILGRLPSAVVYTVGSLYVRAASRAKFGGAHQEGARVGRGRRVRLPQRVFLWLSDALRSAARDVLAKYVAGGMKR